MVNIFEYGIFILGGIACLIWGVAAGIVQYFGKK